MRCSRTVAVLALIAFSSACGGSGAIPKDVSVRLTQQVDAIEQPAIAGDYATARQRAADLRAQVDALRERGVLDEATALRVLRAVIALDLELDLSTTTTTAPATTVAPRTTPPPTTTRAPVATTTTREPKGKDKKDDDED